MIKRTEWIGFSILKKITITTTAFVGTLGVATALWAGYSHLRTEPEHLVAVGITDIQHQEILAEVRNQKQYLAAVNLKFVKEQIITLKVDMVRINNRTGLSVIEKTQSIAVMEEAMDSLKLQKECYEKGRLTCLDGDG